MAWTQIDMPPFTPEQQAHLDAVKNNSHRNADETWYDMHPIGSIDPRDIKVGKLRSRYRTMNMKAASDKQALDLANTMS